jgi:helicase
LTNALQWGVGIHYGPIPEQLRQSIEDDFRGGKIRILISTNTLGQGVNLPIKTALIYSLERVWGEGEENREQIKKRDFWNICGRAGRAGKETEGQIVFVTISDRDKELIDDYSDYQDLESTRIH